MRGGDAHRASGGFHEVANDAEAKPTASRRGPACVVYCGLGAGGESEFESLFAQGHRNAGPIVAHGKKHAAGSGRGSAAIKEADAVSILRGDSDMASGGHGVCRVADQVDENAGEVLDGEPGASNAGHGGYRELDGRAGDCGKQRLKTAQVGGGVRYRYRGERNAGGGGEGWFFLKLEESAGGFGAGLAAILLKFQEE